jgi:hypothetical protein
VQIVRKLVRRWNASSRRRGSDRPLCKPIMIAVSEVAFCAFEEPERVRLEHRCCAELGKLPRVLLLLLLLTPSWVELLQ